MSYDLYNADIPKEAKHKAASRGGKPAEPVPMFSGDETGEDRVNTIAAGQLRSIVERVERLEESKAEIAADIKEVYAEAKADGFDVKALRAIVRMRKQAAAERLEQEAMLDLYKSALGME